MSEKTPELKPEKPADDVEVWLSLTAEDPDAAFVFVMAHREAGIGLSAEQAARQTAFGTDGSHTRCAAVVKVRVPRALLRERWTDAR